MENCLKALVLKLFNKKQPYNNRGAIQLFWKILKAIYWYMHQPVSTNSANKGHVLPQK